VHKGSVAYSDSELGGACFSVTIPLSDKNYDMEDLICDRLTETKTNAVAPQNKVIEHSRNIEITEDSKMLATSTEKPYKNYKLILIDDNDDVREFVQNQLDEYFTVSTASNGVEGFEKVVNEQPDLVICDIMMPGLDGFQLCKRMKYNFETSHIPVIMLTAHSSEKHSLEGIRAGADAYITKPFSMKFLMAHIVKLIEQREKMQQKFSNEQGIIRPSIGITDRDREFIEKFHNIIEKNIENVEFSMDEFAQTLGMGRTVFYKKVKNFTGQSPNEYMRIIRMKKAAELLVTTGLNVSEVSYKVGINDPFYFSKCFKTQFGMSPSQFQKKKEKTT
jgi:YesN/AraC family two-component response regulator